MYGLDYIKFFLLVLGGILLGLELLEGLMVVILGWLLSYGVFVRFD